MDLFPVIMIIKKSKRGFKKKISLSRRAIIDFMYFSQGVAANAVSAEANFCLEKLYSAKRDCAKNLSWYSIFIKAFGMVSQKYPELRQTYFRYPLPHIYEYHEPAAMLAIERKIHDEQMIVFLKIDNPGHLRLVEIDKQIKAAMRQAPEDVKSFRRMLKILRLPFLLRRLAWFWGLNTYTYKWRYFGTFGVTGIGRGVRSLNVKTPLSVAFIFDMNDECKPLFRLYWDHRIFDGVIVSKIMHDLEKILNEQIAQELTNK